MGREGGGGAQGDDAEEDEVNRMGRCIWGCKGSRGGGLGLWFVAVAGAETVPATAAPPVPQLATRNTSTKYSTVQAQATQADTASLEPKPGSFRHEKRETDNKSTGSKRERRSIEAVHGTKGIIQVKQQYKRQD